MKKKLSVFSAAILSVTIISIFLFCNLGEQPLGPSLITSDDTVDVNDTVVWDEGSMELYIDPSELQASYNSTATVSVRIYNTNHNPVSGKTVYFKASHGIIEESAVTDTSGGAAVTFISEPINVEAAIYAWIYDNKGDVVMVGQSVTIDGVTIQIIPSGKNVHLNTVVSVKIFVNDAETKALSKKPVTLSGGVVGTLMTKGDGSVDTTVTMSHEGSITINAESQGAYASDIIKFWKTIPDTVIDTVVGIRRLRLFSSKSQLNADNTDYALITAILLNEKNNPAVGDTIKFESNYGMIDECAVVDETGRATATLYSQPYNCVCEVKAISGALKEAIYVTFSGVSLSLSAEPTNLNINSYSTIDALLTDASTKPIEGDTVKLSAVNGIFDNDSSQIIAITNTNGIAQAKVTANSVCTVTIRGVGPNCSDSTAVTFTNNTLSLTANPTVIPVGGTAYSTLTATYRGGNNAPISGAWIHFYTNAGTLANDSVLTNSGGQAITRLYSADFANVATVQAIAPNGTATATVEFSSITAANINLKISPDNIGINGGVATLTATVTDTNGNMVSGADVNFKILKGPGGDEYIDKPVVTSKDGIARSHIYAGTLPSQYRATEIAASVGTIADTSKMTISGEPYVVTVSRPQDDTIVVTNAGQIGPTTFSYFTGAVVQDVNGNNVADGMEVHFSAVVSGLSVARKRFVRWELSDTDIKPVIEYCCKLIPFEDINNNFIMDKNIDLDLDEYPDIASRGDDVNGDGIMEYSILDYDLFFDFNFNGVCDVNQTEPAYQMVFIVDTTGFDTTIDNLHVDTVIIPYWNPDSTQILYDTTYYIVRDTTITAITEVVDTTATFYADLNNNGVWDKTELYTDYNGNGVCDMPDSKDFQWWRWEMRPHFHGQRFDFQTNDFAVVIASSAVTKDGVAEAAITYPRQMASRLLVTINAEINGIRDKDGERYVLPVLITGK